MPLGKSSLGIATLTGLGALDWLLGFQPLRRWKLHSRSDRSLGQRCRRACSIRHRSGNCSVGPSAHSHSAPRPLGPRNSASLLVKRALADSQPLRGHARGCLIGPGSDRGFSGSWRRLYRVWLRTANQSQYFLAL